MNLENKPDLAKAIIAVMKSVKGIDKDMNVGTGNSSYKGVSDQSVKKILDLIADFQQENQISVSNISMLTEITETPPHGRLVKQSINLEVKL